MEIQELICKLIDLNNSLKNACENESKDIQTIINYLYETKLPNYSDIQIKAAIIRAGYDLDGEVANYLGVV